VAYVPHRWYEKEQAMHGVNQLRVIGASNGLALNFWKAFYSNIHIPLHAVSLDVAVMTKITENAYRYLQIAFAEELKLSCKKLGVDFEVLKNACNTKWNIKILDALTGIGGTCLPKDMEFYSQAVGNSTLCWAARIVNENYVKETNK
jgi:UDP-N-acetyl-D-mannosaminuronic acid dehydrogenase